MDARASLVILLVGALGAMAAAADLSQSGSQIPTGPHYGPKLDPTAPDEPPVPDQLFDTSQLQHTPPAGAAAKPPKKGRVPPRVRSTAQDVLRVAPPPAPPRPMRAPPPPPLPATAPSPPQPVQCDAGGCTNAAGQRLNGGVGTVLLDPDGRACVRTGGTVQCQ